ncbi:glycosyltransferase family 2 protein [Protaetiibacter larvae]|uniref:Glycosyltransferase family 2 protein n=1 Tax=Protaetiibacter larvae TaxID=2592654 RepID=A0A5C1Y3P9_9MICO|nr:glycosyltransferase family 2 protein [Protaetiibacter larvae]QEO08633.1 glycosyltransferase family 2 protein [Protaetiibacter larvae]
MSAAVGVVVVTYRSAPVLPALLASLADAGSNPIELVVVDNSPEDDGVEALVAAFPGARLVPSRDNPGYGTAANRGIRALSPEVRWAVIANPDVVVAPHALDALLAGAERHPDAGSLGPLIRDPDGTVYPSGRNLPSLRTGVGHAAFVRVWPRNPWTRRYRNDRELRERGVGWLSGAFLLVNRAAFERIGGFDEDYFMYFEDVDLGRRLTKAGHGNYYIPAAEVTHTGAESTRHAPRAMIVAHHRSAYRYLASKYHGWYLWPLRVVLRIGLAFRARVARG